MKFTVTGGGFRYQKRLYAAGEVVDVQRSKSAASAIKKGRLVPVESGKTEKPENDKK